VIGWSRRRQDPIEEARSKRGGLVKKKEVFMAFHPERKREKVTCGGKKKSYTVGDGVKLQEKELPIKRTMRLHKRERPSRGHTAEALDRTRKLAGKDSCRFQNEKEKGECVSRNQ